MSTAASQGMNQPDCPSAGTSQRMILVADDDAMIRSLVKALMQKDGHAVLACADGQEGLELLRPFPGRIDRAITDLEIPHLNGADFCARLRVERPGARILVI